MSKRRDVILAVKALAAAALPSAQIRGFDGDTVKPQTIPPAGCVIGHPGSPGEAVGVDLGVTLTYHFEHEIVLEIAPSLAEADPAAALDTILEAIGTGVLADRTLGGLCDFLDVTAANEDDEPLDGSVSARWAEVSIIASYSTNNPLGD